MLELTKQCDSVDNVRLVCILWAYNFIENGNLADNDRMWHSHMKNYISACVGILTNILYQRQRFDKLREFLNSSQFDKRRVKPFKLGKCYSRLFDGLLQEGDHSSLIVELKKASKYIPAKYIDAETLERLKNESIEIAAVIDDMNGIRHV